MLELWYAALASPLGVVVDVVEGTTEQARQKLYAARANAEDPDLAALSLVVSPSTPNQIWILKRAPSKSDVEPSGG
jgi:hypothetical protein